MGIEDKQARKRYSRFYGGSLKMDIDELRKKSRAEGVPQAMVEKDYALSVALVEIAKSTVLENIVFKGGTAIKKAHFHKARFSEDLDFSTTKLTKEQILKELKHLLENKELFGVKFGEVNLVPTIGLRAYAKFVSFLQYPQSVRFDFSFRDNTLLKPIEKELFDDYELGKVSFNVVQLEEILADKVQAVTSRTAARDLYDIWFLFNKGVKLEREVVEKKFAYYKETFEFEKLEKRLPTFEPLWKRDLQQFIKMVPNFDEVVKEVLHNINRQLK